MSFIFNVLLVGNPSNLGLSVIEYCVLDKHIGNLIFLNLFSLSNASSL